MKRRMRLPIHVDRLPDDVVYAISRSMVSTDSYEEDVMNLLTEVSALKLPLDSESMSVGVQQIDNMRLPLHDIFYHTSKVEYKLRHKSDLGDYFNLATSDLTELYNNVVKELLLGGL